MPRPPLRQFFLQNASLGAQSYYLSPYIVEFGFGTDYAQSREDETSPYPMSFLAWVQMWVRLALGLDPRERPARSGYLRHSSIRIHHKQVRAGSGRKPAAHNLAALMRFAPDANGAGLTLNQYRERFTRLSVLGRVRIYPALSPFGRRKVAAMRNVLGRICHAPLRPD